MKRTVVAHARTCMYGAQRHPAVLALVHGPALLAHGATPGRVAGGHLCAVGAQDAEAESAARHRHALRARVAEAFLFVVVFVSAVC